MEWGFSNICLYIATGQEPTGEVCVAPVCHLLHHALVLHSAGALPVGFIADGLGKAEEAWPWTL